MPNVLGHMEGETKERAQRVIEAVSAAMKEEHELKGGIIRFGWRDVVEIREKTGNYGRVPLGKLFVNVRQGHEIAKAFHESKKRPDLPVEEIAKLADASIAMVKQSQFVTERTEGLRDETRRWLLEQGLTDRLDFYFGTHNGLSYRLKMQRGAKPKAFIEFEGLIPAKRLPEFLKLWDEFKESEVES